MIQAPGSFDKIRAVMPNALSAIRNGLAAKEKVFKFYSRLLTCQDLFLTSLEIFSKLVVLLGIIYR